MIAPTPSRPALQALTTLGRKPLSHPARFGLGPTPGPLVATVDMTDLSDIPATLDPLGPPKPSTGWRYRSSTISYQLQAALDQHEDRPYPEVAA